MVKLSWQMLESITIWPLLLVIEKYVVLLQLTVAEAMG